METIGSSIVAWGGLIIAVLSMIIALISLIKSIKAQSLQNRVNELELKIKQSEVDTIEKTKAEKNMTCVEARIISMGDRKYRLKIWNSGNATTYNVRASFKDNPEIIMLADDILPYDELETKKSFEIDLIIHFASAKKARVITEWEDKSGNHCSKEQTVSY